MRSRIRTLALGLLALPIAIASASEARDPVSRDRAVEIARAAAREGGVDIDNYVLAEKGPVTDLQGREWLVGFVRTNVPWRPGSDLLVAVDRSTGEAKLMPGQ